MLYDTNIPTQNRNSILGTKRASSTPPIEVILKMHSPFLETCNSLPHIRRNDTGNLHAVALTGQSAALVPFQWHQPNHSPFIDVNSADSSLNPASHFGGISANSAQTAIPITYEHFTSHLCI